MYTIFTVDVEGHVGNAPVKHLIYGETEDGKLCGIDMLMDVLDRYKIRGLFFVDIAEVWDYGEQEIGDVLQHIKERGHDVGVHIHPDHMADKSRLFLSEYNREEQFDIIKKCTDFYECVLGERPIAFRAGKYGANRETLEILAEFGFKADFSEFYGQKWCHIDPPVAKVNVQRIDNGLIEIPVTSYISLDVGFYSRYDKMDCGQPISEFKTVFDELKKNKNDIAVLFAHSFSLIDWRRTPNKPRFQKGMKDRLEAQLEYIKSKKEVVNLDIHDAIKIFSNAQCGDMKSESFVKLKGIMPLYWFAIRAQNVLKTKIDIKRRVNN